LLSNIKGGDRIKNTKIIPVRWIPDNFDSDWDGVPNYRDCEPFNPNKQDTGEVEEILRYGKKITPFILDKDNVASWAVYKLKGELWTVQRSGTPTNPRVFIHFGRAMYDRMKEKRRKGEI